MIEEFLDGEEVSFFALVDGEAAVPLVGAGLRGRRACGGRGAVGGGRERRKG